MSGQTDNPNTSMTVMVGLVGALITFFSIIGLQALYYRSERKEFEAKVVSAVPEQLRSLRASQEEALLGGRWVDQSKGLVTIPIEQAMALVVRDAAASATLAGGPR